MLQPTSADAGRSRRLRRLRHRAARLPTAITDALRRIRDFVCIDDITIDLYDRDARRRGSKVARLQLRRAASPKAGDPDAWMVVARKGETTAESDPSPPGPVIELEAGESAPDPEAPHSPRDPR